MDCCSLPFKEPGQNPTLVGIPVWKDTLHPQYASRTKKMKLMNLATFFR